MTKVIVEAVFADEKTSDQDKLEAAAHASNGKFELFQKFVADFCTYKTCVELDVDPTAFLTAR